MASAAVAECIGPYRAIRQLGAGGMGEVFLAHDDELGRNIAIKLLPPHLAADAEHLGRLRNEARSASSLNHPNIVTIYEIGRDDSQRAFMAMEYVDGQTLREVLRGDALPVRKTLQIAAQIADGLAAAHKRGLVHRDLKPENIMITTDGVVKILDFGLAKTFGGDTAVSEPGMLVGTYSYMSPEQARAGEIDYRSDQFSFGSILYEMLTGARAFGGASGVETLFMVVRDEPASLSAVASHVPAPLRWIVDRCLSKDPDDRYVSTRDLARDIQYLRDHFSEAGTPTPIREKDSLSTRLRKRWPAAAAAALALVAGSLVTAWARRPEPRTITSERYLTYSGHDYSPAVSRDGKLIAFSSSRDGKQRIWLKQVADGSEVALTAGGGDDFPRFSPDASTILYIHAEPGQRGELWRVPVVGGEPRKLLDVVGTADFSRDGSRIAFTRNANGLARTDLYIANADGSNAHELAKLDIGAVHPRWSPDGKSIAVVTPRSGRVVQSVVIVNVATGEGKLLATPPKPGEISSVAWTTDGRHVLYVRAESVEAVVGSTAKVVRHDVRSDVSEVIGWSTHNGFVLDDLGNGRIVLDARSPRDNLRELGPPDKATERAVEKWITRGNSSDRQPAYSPDGRALLFTSNRSGNLDLWITTTDGGVRRVTDDASEDWDPAFTPDGKKIVWSSGRSGKLEIWIANTDGTGAKQISRDGVDAENPTATPDGWIVYNSFNTAKPGIWKVRADGTQATHLVKALTSLPEVSPDGRYVAYLADSLIARPKIRVARVSDGRDMGVEIPVSAIRRTSAILGRSRWMPDSKAIAFLAQNAEGINGVFVQDFVPGRDTSATRRELGGFDRERATESFGIAPDGKTMTVAGWEQLFSLFSIEGLPLKKKATLKKES